MNSASSRSRIQIRCLDEDPTTRPPASPASALGVLDRTEGTTMPSGWRGCQDGTQKFQQLQHLTVTDRLQC